MRPQCRPASPVSARSDMEYREEDFLSLSGLQHFSFCRRQWALIHIEQQWQENLRTVEGALLHQKAHGPFVTEKRGDLLISRGMPVFSRSLGVNGVCDVVELRAAPDGVPIAGRGGRYLPMAVEYKRGSPKEVWRRCLDVKFQKQLSIMGKLGAVPVFPWEKTCAVGCGRCSMKCICCFPAGTPPRPSLQNTATRVP